MIRSRKSWRSILSRKTPKLLLFPPMNFFQPESSELSGASGSRAISSVRSAELGVDGGSQFFSPRVASQHLGHSSEFPLRLNESTLGQLGKSPSRLGDPTDTGRGARLIVGSVGVRHSVPVRTSCGTCQTTKTKPKNPPILAAGSTQECEWTRSERIGVRKTGGPSELSQTVRHCPNC